MYKKSKANYLTLFLLSIILVISTQCKKKEVKPIVGDTYKGGKVFYVDNTGLHGLVASATDLSAGAPWGCMGSVLSGADGTANGTGNQNTADIIKGCSEAGTAAKLCNDLVLEGFSDWYLPSKDELNLMYQQKDMIGGFIKDKYWSSTEATGVAAWLQDFDGGAQYGTTQKDYGTSVRAIRAF